MDGDAILLGDDMDDVVSGDEFAKAITDRIDGTQSCLFPSWTTTQLQRLIPALPVLPQLVGVGRIFRSTSCKAEAVVERKQHIRDDVHEK